MKRSKEEEERVQAAIAQHIMMKGLVVLDPGVNPDFREYERQERKRRASNRSRTLAKSGHGDRPVSLLESTEPRAARSEARPAVRRESCGPGELASSVPALTASLGERLKKED